MKKIFKLASLFCCGAIAVSSLASCSDDDSLSTSEQQSTEIKAIAEQFLSGTVYPTYTLLANGTDTLYDKLNDLQKKAHNGETITASEMQDVADVFLRARANYELSEAFLFGAASDFGIDPHIDSWPLDLATMQTSLNNTAIIEGLRDDNGDADGAYAGTALSPATLGFHGIEYVLFRDGQVRTDLNEPDAGLNNLSGELELLYAAAVAGDLRNYCVQMEVLWNADASDEHKALVEENEMATTMTNGSTYGENMLNAAQAGSTYSNWIRVMNDIIISGCQNIADEVANTKIGKPYYGTSDDDLNYIESPYSQKSIQDFTHNMQSIQNVLLGGREESRNQSASVYNYLNSRNPEMAATLVEKLNTAISAVSSMAAPFVNNKKDASVLTAINAVNDLSNYLVTVDEYIRTND